MADRELGSETTPCPTCGAELAMTENADGSMSPARCSNCYPEDIVEVANEADAPLAKETGTDTNDESAVTFND
jgi:hypothetical protein